MRGEMGPEKSEERCFLEAGPGGRNVNAEIADCQTAL